MLDAALEIQSKIAAKKEEILQAEPGKDVVLEDTTIYLGGVEVTAHVLVSRKANQSFNPTAPDLSVKS